MNNYLTKDDLINNAVIEEDDFTELQINWILKFTKNQIDNITGFKIIDTLNGTEYPANLTSFQQSCILEASLLLAKQMIATGSDELIRGGNGISTGSMSINQTNPNDPYYVHPQVYDFLTKAGFYSQIELLNIKGQGGNKVVPFNSDDAQYDYITIDYAKKNLIAKPLGNPTNALIAGDGVNVEFLGTGDGYGQTKISINMSILTNVIIQQLGDMANSLAQIIYNLIASNAGQMEHLAHLMEQIILNDTAFKEVLEQALRTLVSQDEVFIGAIAEILSTLPSFMNELIAQILPKLPPVNPDDVKNIVNEMEFSYDDGIVEELF